MTAAIPHAFVARRPCGCVEGSLTDHGRWTPQDGLDLALWLRRGLTLTWEPLDPQAPLVLGCRCAAMETPTEEPHDG